MKTDFNSVEWALKGQPLKGSFKDGFKDRSLKYNLNGKVEALNVETLKVKALKRAGLKDGLKWRTLEVGLEQGGLEKSTLDLELQN